MRFYFTALLFLFSLQLAIANDFETFRQNGKYGLKNTITGEEIFAPLYDEIGWSQGEFKVVNGQVGLKQNEKWALADITGSKVTRHHYSSLYPFTESLFIASKRSNFSILNEYGVLNNKGDEVIPISYQWVEPVGSALIVSKKNGARSQFGVLNKNGKFIIPLEFEKIEKLDNQTLSVQDQKGLSALYTLQGKQISDFLYETILRYDDKNFKVKYFNKEGLIDNKGEIIIPPQYKSISLKDGKAQVLPFPKWSMFSSENGEERTLNFDQVWPFKNGRLAVQTNENAGIIDQKNDYIFYRKEVRIKHVSDPFIALESNQLQGAITVEGKTILPFQYDSIQFFDQAIFARMNTEWQAFDLNGKRIGLQSYHSIEEQTDGTFLASKNDRKGILNAEGIEQTPFIFTEIGHFKNGLAVASYQGNQGVIKQNGNWAITPYKDSITIVDDRIYYQQGSDFGVYDLLEYQLMRSDFPIQPMLNTFSVKTNNGFNLYSKNAALILEETYDSIYQINEEMIVLKSKKRFELYNLETGEKHKLSSHTQNIRAASEDFISAKMDSVWGFVSKRGLLSIANRYTEAKEFSEGFCAVKLNGGWGFIDKRDEIAVQPIFDKVDSFKNGLAVVVKTGKSGLINIHDEFILDPIYTVLERHENYILLKTEKGYGLSNATGALIRTPQFESISTQDGIHFKISRKGKEGVINISGVDTVPISFEKVIQIGSTFLGLESQQWQAYKKP